LPPPSRPNLFPYTTLFRSHRPEQRQRLERASHELDRLVSDSDVAGKRALEREISAPCRAKLDGPHPGESPATDCGSVGVPALRLDRKSTRLNSSHVKISYA